MGRACPAHLLLSGNTLLELEVVLEGPTLVDVLEVGTIFEDTVLLLGHSELGAVHVGEAVLLGDDDLLATSELVAGTAKGLHDDGLVRVTRAHTQEDLANIDTGDSVVRLAPGTTHTGLQSVSACAGQHLVDTDHVEGVHTDTQVEGVLSAGLGDILVCANTGSFESFGSDLLVLIADKVAAEWEVIDRRLLAAKIVNADLGVWHTTVVPALREGLVLAVAVATSWTATHLD